MPARPWLPIAVFGAVWLAAPPNIAQPGGTGSASNEPVARKAAFVFDVSLQSRYDDNILELSQDDIDRVESGTSAPDRFLITTPDDFITTLAGRVRWTGKPWKRRETRIGLAAQANRYRRNDVKDYETFGISIAQELTPAKRHLARLRLSINYTPDYYLRQLTDDDASVLAGRRIRSSARYEETSYRLVYDQDFVSDRFDGRATLLHQRRDYNEFFPERDSSRDTVAVTLGGRPFARSRFALEGTAGRGRLDARGDLPATPFLDDDISYDVALFGLDAVVPWKGKRGGRFEIEAGYEQRDYTTSNKFDTTRYRRSDDRLTWRAEIIQKLPANLEVSAGYERETNDAAWPASFVSSDETTDYTASRFTVALRWQGSTGR